MRHYMSHWMIVFFSVLSGINIALFIFWFGLIDIKLMPDDEGEWDYVLNSISVQITILEAAIVVVSVFLALLGIVGYKQIRDHAEETAEKTAEFVATDMANNQIDLLKQHFETEIEAEVKRQLSGEKKETQTDENDVLKGAKKINGDMG